MPPCASTEQASPGSVRRVSSRTIAATRSCCSATMGPAWSTACLASGSTSRRARASVACGYGYRRLDGRRPQSMMQGLMRVLVVDDHREVLELVDRALSRDQHQVFTADSAERALEELGARRPDIVVLDLGLPDGSGEDLCRRIRGSDDGTAILVLTAQSAVASRVRCL